MKPRIKRTNYPVGTLFQFEDGMMGLVLDNWDDGGVLYWNCKFNWENVFYSKDFYEMVKVLFVPK